MVISLNETQQSAEHHYKLLINIQNELRRSGAYLLSSAYRKVSDSISAFCANTARMAMVASLASLLFLRGLVRYINEYGPTSRWYNLHLLFLSFDFYKNL